MKFRKKPVVIEAFLLTGNVDQLEDPVWFVDLIKAGTAERVATGWAIQTLEGRMTAQWGDYIIKGVKEEIYPCKPDIFEATYEAV